MVAVCDPSIRSPDRTVPGRYHSSHLHWGFPRMNYYKRHLGDYAKNTSVLSVVEHGLYNLFLDWYYVTEQPITQDIVDRLARGYEAEAKFVLLKFFTLADDGWRNSRADEEIRDYHKKAKRNQEVGKLGGRPKEASGNPDETQTVFKNNPDVTLAISHKPLAKEESKAVRQPDGCPHDEIIAAYHRLLPANPKIKSWTNGRRAHLRQRWREDPKRQSLDYWERFFRWVSASAFLTGQASGRDGRPPFVAGLDWLVRPENFAKVIEGNYHREQGAA